VVLVSKKGIPSREECILLLWKLGVNEKLIEHTKAVSRNALEIAERIEKNGVSVDTKLVEAGGLLHDIGRSKVHGLEHGVVGGTILRELGYPASLARIAETHVLCGVIDEKPEEKNVSGEKDHTPNALEEKIVCYADKITVEKKKTTLEKRFDKWFRQYGRTPFLERAFQRSKEIEAELNSLLSKKR
jgi:uncharacterized protein